MRRFLLWLSLILCFPNLYGQFVAGPSYSELKEYFGLSDAQEVALRRINERLLTFTAAKNQRSRQVEREIQEELARPTMDVDAIGVRCRELELIRRELSTEEERTRREAGAVLTAAQQPKLVALGEALRLRGTACAAVQANLLFLLPRLVLATVPGGGESACGSVVTGIINLPAGGRP